MEEDKNNAESQEGKGLKQVPQLLRDFVADLLTTFPEYKECIEEYAIEAITADLLDNENMHLFVEYIQQVYPSRFFDILYKNEDIFKVESEVDTCFIPGLDFKKIWNTEGITDTIKDTIWRYLQVILFSVINGVASHDSFGDTAKLFEAINEEDFKSKLEETMSSLQDAMGSIGEGGLFGNASNNKAEDEQQSAGENEDGENNRRSSNSSSMPDLPLPEEIHDHINGLLQGNLGKLATEIAEETAQDFDFDMEGVDSVNDVFQKMFRDPGKIMGLVKNIGSKLDSKIKDNEINKEDLMKEATDMMSKMKDMPGMDNISSMFKNMGMDMNDMSSMAKNIPGLSAALGGGGKLNVGAMQAALERNLQSSKKIDQIKKRHEYRMMEKQRKEEEMKVKQKEIAENYVEMNDQELEEFIFSIEGGQQATKTSRFPEKGTDSSENAGKTGKKKKNKKKGKK